MPLKETSLYFIHSLSVLFLHDREGISKFPFSLHFRRANTDSLGPIHIQEGKYGFSRANTEPSLDVRKTNMKPFMHFCRANTETY